MLRDGLAGLGRAGGEGQVGKLPRKGSTLTGPDSACYKPELVTVAINKVEKCAVSGREWKTRYANSPWMTLAQCALHSKLVQHNVYVHVTNSTFMSSLEVTKE